MATLPNRPLSPHLSIWRWRVHMLVSILHRVTGAGLSTVAAILFVWWLVAAATGPEAYARFHSIAISWIGVVVGIGLTWVLFQHTASGIRHLVMDTGAGYEIGKAKASALATLAASVLGTAALWAAILLG